MRKHTTLPMLLWALVLLFTTGIRAAAAMRQRILLDDGWKFYRYPNGARPDSLIYDVRPVVADTRDDKAADAMPTEAEAAAKASGALKAWILPTGNDFLNDKTKQTVRPPENPGQDFPFVKASFNDKDWESVTVPHDWAIKGPFYAGEGVPVGGGMGRLPVQGVAWYRRKLDLPVAIPGTRYYLQFDGAMSYAMVWVNGKLAGGWPYGYTSWQLDITPYIVAGKSNQLAIRLDNPPSSSRWYPGGGLYRNVWLCTTNAVQVDHWGTRMQTTEVSGESARLHYAVTIRNENSAEKKVRILTDLYLLNPATDKPGKKVASFAPEEICTKAKAVVTARSELLLKDPCLWGPAPEQLPVRYVAVTTLWEGNQAVDRYETIFGIRSLRFDPEQGLFVNNKKVVLKGVNQHHDLGALGAAFNLRAAERQLKMLQEMGCNAIRMSHNPPDPALLDLTDRMGFVVIDEIFDCWQRKKTPLDFHLIFDDWSEQDLRAMIRRDYNHPSVIVWSFGNEVGEQYTGEEGADVAKRLLAIVRQEDSTRPTTLAMNYAKPDMPLPAVPDLIGLNYQGEGIRNGGAYAGLKGISTPPLFPRFHQQFAQKMILSTENASALSSRGSYLFPVFPENSAPIRDGQGGDSKTHQVSAYELYSVDFGSSADKVFATLSQHPYVAGGFAWTGWDYLGEPTPYYSSRSSYSGIIDLAGFRKDRFYLYQACWRPELPLAHLLPHWTWPGREGLVTPVHVMTSGDEAELFVNGVSQGRKKRQPGDFRLRWDSVVYQPGSVQVKTYKNGKPWAEETMQTAGPVAAISLQADRTTIKADGKDLCFVTVRLTDVQGTTAPDAQNELEFSVQGAVEFVAADNGDASDLTAFPSCKRKAFNGFCMVILRGMKNTSGQGVLTVRAAGMPDKSLKIRTQ